MSTQSDLDYFNGRAVEERQLSEKSLNADAAAIHARLADCYERLAKRERKARPTLHIASH